jgi:broad specificity phosphatase PhoE
VIRHGQAHAGFLGPIAGPTGCAGLTDLGRRQAVALRDHLAASGRVRADVLLTSMLPRAIETAEIVAPGLGLEVGEHDCDLCEVHTGSADGMDWKDYNAELGSFDMEAEPDRPFAPGGESWNGFHERVGRALDRLARDHADETVIVVCHAGVIMASVRLLLGIGHADISAQLRPDNTGLTEWEHDGDRWTLRSYNESVHLLGLDVHAGLDIEAAREAAATDDLAGWVHRFLSSDGSDNPVLADLLTDPPRSWLGPVLLPFDQLHRLAGPEGDPVLVAVDDDDWRDDVLDLARKAEDGHEPPPLVASYRDGQLVLEDGNHRAEALRRAGRPGWWTVVAFEDAATRDRWVARSAALEDSPTGG